ncbi:transcription factor bHLH144-like [Lolium rigidum]|uniref:transcription factor bHLH144-like n=1 Tax=Lolium rigidum TaxID=89674 RepID=UPI001F5DE9FE|nr:transcription factor bHLH144-like [Lolium rigidum]
MQGDPGYGYGGYGGYGYGYGGGYGNGYDMAAYGNGGAYYPNDHRYPAAAPPAPAAYEDPLAGRRQHDFPAPLTGLEFQPSDTCPKNYVIFDQTYDRSRVMYHPSLANNFGSSGGYDQHCNNNNGGYDQNYVGKSTYYGGGDDGGGECSIRQKEDTDEIDALMSSGDGEEEDDVLSTGRTPGCRGGGSPDSTCSSGYVVSVSPTGNNATGNGGGGGERKKDRMKKMMKTLKGIIPGGDRMDTPAVLDEAVRYLKSLKVEVKKLGVRGSRS